MPSSPSSHPASAFPSNHAWALLGLLGLAALGTYCNSLNAPFFFDDGAAIVDNPTIRDLSDLRSVLSPPRGGSGVTGRPIVNLTLALNYAISGTQVRGYHFTNVLLHVAASLVLFGAVRRTLSLESIPVRFRRSAIPLAFLSAAGWMLHPLQTETVTCVIQRTELLVGLFYLTTLYAFIRSAGERSKTWAIFAMGTCWLGMASKEVMVSAPLIVLLYDRTFVAGSFAAAWRARRGLHLGIAAGWILLGVLIFTMGGSRGEAAGFGVGVTWWSYAFKQCEAIVHYLRLVVWPHPLVVFYGVDVVTDLSKVWAPGLMLCLLAGATFYAALRRSPWGFLGLWFFAILAPSSSIVPLVSQTMSEHRMYLPLAAPVVGGTLVLFSCLGRRAITVGLAMAIALGLASARRNVDYRSELAIWNDTVAKVPGNARARVNYGAALKSVGNLPAALAQYRAAVRQDPRNPEALNNVATILIETGHPADAVAPCLAALRLRPEFAMAHNNLGSALVQIGELAQGVAHLKQAVALRPQLPEAHMNLAAALLATGEVDAAIRHGEEAVRLSPNSALGYSNLANAYLKRNRRAEAVTALESAVRCDPRSAEAHSNLGALYYQAGDPQRAIGHFEAAIRNRPNFLDAHNNLASAYAQTGRIEEAIAEYRSVIATDPNYPEAHSNLGLVLAKAGRISEAIAAFEAALRLRPNDAQLKDYLDRLKSSSAVPR